MKFKIAYFFSILSILIFLLFFSQKRNTNKKKLKVDIDFKHENGKFLDSQMVNKLLIQSEDSTFYLEKDALDLNVLEDLLISNPMIANADVFRTPQGILKVKLEERSPVIRVINNHEQFYIDKYGYRVPLSKKYSARVPIFYGKLNSNLTDLINFIELIKIDSLTKFEIIDMRVINDNYVLGVRSFPFKILWGKNTKYRHKLKKLKYLYSYLGGLDSLKIQNVNLIFDKQIVLDYGQNGK